eukprot:Gregarina_sp_Poly_1__8157@NODE_471_length_8141_cov_141_032821_g382_i0_p1_GENE_NODE_471_length_8141_cov_141_032821_g382_i0NODE_471_length_8141_cov_141_032821_g382_i0_p1_ORF_typecomplete_len1091_score189_63MIF4G/PF02854_19/4_9e39MIF4G/PF02854_19/2e03_NODE_471_length_8141_cov_141_032821_g382_i036216893
MADGFFPNQSSAMESSATETGYYGELGSGGGGLKRTHNSVSEFGRHRGASNRFDFKHPRPNHPDFDNARYGNPADDSSRYSHKPPNRGWKRGGGYGDSGGGGFVGGGGYKAALSRGGIGTDAYYGRGGHSQRGGNKRGTTRVPSSQQPLTRMTSGESESQLPAGRDGEFSAASGNRYNAGRSLCFESETSRLGSVESRSVVDRNETGRGNEGLRLQKNYYSSGGKGVAKVPHPPPLSQTAFDGLAKSGDVSADTPRDGLPKSARSVIPPPPEQPLMKNPSHQKFRGSDPVRQSDLYPQQREHLGNKSGKESSPQSPKNRYMLPQHPRSLPHNPYSEFEFIQQQQQPRVGMQPWQPTASVAASAPPVAAKPVKVNAIGDAAEVPQFMARAAGPDPSSVVCLVPRIASMSIHFYTEVLSRRKEKEREARELLELRDREREMRDRENAILREQQRSSQFRGVAEPTSQLRPNSTDNELKDPSNDKDQTSPTPLITPKDQPSPEPHKTKKYSIEFCLSLREDALRFCSKDMTPMKMTELTPLAPSHSAGRMGHHRRRSLGSGNIGTHHSPAYGNRTLIPEAPWPRNVEAPILQHSSASMPHSPSSSAMLLPSRSHPNKTQLPRDVALRRSVKGLLNKLTVEQFESIANSLSSEIQKTQNAQELGIVMEEVHSKSVREPNFSEMYADLVLVLRARSPVFPSAVSDKPDTFQRLLIIKCQTEFDQMKDFANLELSAEDMKGMTEEDIENERVKRKTRTLGNMRFIGELNLRKIVANTALATILEKLVEGDPQYPPAHVVECVCELLTTIGYHMDNSEKEGDKGALNTVFSHLQEFHERRIYESRINFKIQNLLELRGSNWRTKFTFVDKANTLSNIRDSPNQNNVHIVGRQSDYPYKAFVRELNEDWLQRRKEQKKREADSRHSPSKGERSCCDAVGAFIREKMLRVSNAEETPEATKLSQMYPIKEIVRELTMLGCDPTIRQDLVVSTLQSLASSNFEDCSVALSQTLLSILESIARRSTSIKPISELLARLILEGSYQEAMLAQMVWPGQTKSADARQLLEKIQEITAWCMAEVNPNLSQAKIKEMMESHGVGF